MDETVIRRAIQRVAEQRIREAMEAGDFDGLEGAGRPLPNAEATYDEQWWVRSWLRREGLERMGRTMNAPDERRARAIASIEVLREAREPDRARPADDASSPTTVPEKDAP